MNRKIVAIIVSIILFETVLHLDFGSGLTGKIEDCTMDDEVKI